MGLGLLRLTNCHYSPPPAGVMLREGRGGLHSTMVMGHRRHGPRFQLPDSLPPSLFWISLPPSKYEAHLSKAIEHAAVDFARAVTTCVPREADDFSLFGSLRQFFLDWPGVDSWSTHVTSQIGLHLTCQKSIASGFVFKIMFPFQPGTPWPVQPTLFPRRKLEITSVRPSLLSMKEEKETERA